MIRFSSVYYTSTGIGIPVHFQIQRLKRANVVNNYFDGDNRDSWCVSGDKPCPMFDTRPCCPPRIPTFDKLRERDYLYAVHIRFFLKDFLKAYPVYKNPSNQAFFMSNIVRIACRKILYESELQLRDKGDTMFKVGGCSACSFKKGKPCKSCVTPALEGVGVKVSQVCEEVFNSPIQWLGVDKIEYFTALGGIYTSKQLGKEDFKKEIDKVCYKFKK